MKRIHIKAIFILTISSLCLSNHLLAQNDTPVLDTQVNGTVLIKRGIINNDSAYTNYASGEFTPGRGFDLVRTKFGTLNISLYAMARYLNQMPGTQTWQDHLGRPHDFTGRNDFYWHRSMIWFSGWLGTPKFTYTATVWTVFTTQQTLIYGNMQYKANKHFRFGLGVGPNLSVRSMQGSFPFYSSTDRTMGEDALRGGFTHGFWITGEVVPKLYYNVMFGNNLSTLGIQASKLTRNIAKSVSVWWMPTTGEFGPRGGIGDMENHDKVATRFGVSYVNSREDRFNNIGTPSPDNTQIRMTDGVLFFETGALADNVTVDNATYNMFSVDMGVKYRGFNLQAEVYGRKLSKFAADGPLPLSELNDFGYSLQVNKMIIPQKLMLYGVHSYFFDEFKRHPWEVGLGINLYPLKNRSWRLNGQVMHVYKTAAGGTFGLYTAGQTGTTITFGSDILL